MQRDVVVRLWVPCQLGRIRGPHRFSACYSHRGSQRSIVVHTERLPMSGQPLMISSNTRRSPIHPFSTLRARNPAYPTLTPSAKGSNITCIIPARQAPHRPTRLPPCTHHIHQHIPISLLNHRSFDFCIWHSGNTTTEALATSTISNNSQFSSQKPLHPHIHPV